MRTHVNANQTLMRASEDVRPSMPRPPDNGPGVNLAYPASHMTELRNMLGFH